MKLTKSTFEWSKIYTFQDIHNARCDNFTCAGVYIWGIRSNSVYIPFYVGKTINISKRLKEHLGCFFGGSYRIPRNFHNIDLNDQSKFLHIPDSPSNIAKYIYTLCQSDLMNIKQDFWFAHTRINEKDVRKGLEIYIRDLFGREKLITKIIGKVEKEQIIFKISDKQLLKTFQSAKYRTKINLELL